MASELSPCLSVIRCSSCQEEVDENCFVDGGGMQTCPQCGCVLAEEQIFSHEVSSSFANYDHSDFMGVHRFRLPPRPSHMMLTRGEKNLRELIAVISEKLQLTTEVMEQIQHFAMQVVFPHPFFRYLRWKIRVAGACTYILCRKNDLTVTIKQVAVAAGCSHFAIGDIVKLLDIVFQLHQPPVNVRSFISTACSHLPKSDECKELAHQVCDITEQTMEITSNPLAKAIAHSVLASLAVNRDTKTVDVVSPLCEKMSYSAEGTVLVILRRIKAHVLTLLREIPWLDMKNVKKDKVQFYLKDITRYRQQIGKFSVENQNPSWFGPREKEMMSRQMKIHNAMERIRVRQSPSSHKPDQADNATPTGEPLDEEDKVIEELLERGCSPADLQEGFYETLLKTSFVADDEIQESEIELYMRKPEEVETVKRIWETEEGEVDLKPPKKRWKRNPRMTKIKNFALIS